MREQQMQQQQIKQQKMAQNTQTTETAAGWTCACGKSKYRKILHRVRKNQNRQMAGLVVVEL